MERCFRYRALPKDRTAIQVKNTAYAKWVMASHSVNVQQKQEDASMEGAKGNIWAGFDVGKASFSAALDQLTENSRAKITTQPCREFKRTPEGVEQYGNYRLLFATFDRLD